MSVLPQYPLTEAVEEVLRQAQEAARHYAHQYVGTEHLLLGVLAHSSGEIPALLRSQGIDPDAIPAIVAQTVRRGKLPDAAPRIRPYTSRAQHALQVAAQEAAASGHAAVDLLHLLLALCTDSRGIATQIMTGVGIQTESLRRAAGDRRSL